VGGPPARTLQLVRVRRTNHPPPILTPLHRTAPPFVSEAVAPTNGQGRQCCYRGDFFPPYEIQKTIFGRVNIWSFSFYLRGELVFFWRDVLKKIFRAKKTHKFCSVGDAVLKNRG